MWPACTSNSSTSWREGRDDLVLGERFVGSPDHLVGTQRRAAGIDQETVAEVGDFVSCHPPLLQPVGAGHEQQGTVHLTGKRPGVLGVRSGANAYF